MACNVESSEDDSSFSNDSDEQLSGSDAASLSGEEFDAERSEQCLAGGTQTVPCKYYNKGYCKNRNCMYLHVCKYHFDGNCKFGKNCRLSHRMRSDSESSSSSDEDTPTRGRRQLTEKHYQWQIRDSKGWNDIKHDHVIEAQYSMPGTKGMKLYHTKCGMISIDFNKMRVHGKDLKVRRKTLENSPVKDEWLWYYHCKHNWKLFSDKNNKSADIECQYQQNLQNSIQITSNQRLYKIIFREMIQVSLVTGSKRRLKRRPKLQKTRGANSSLSDSMDDLNISGQRKQYIWQFSGNHGNWFDYKMRRGTDTECSVSSKEIELEYLQNQQGGMIFYMNNSKYKLDFSAMTQSNLSTGATRSIRRVCLSLSGKEIEDDSQ
ncbi:uncharacterized protein si:ch211-244b2.4 [Chiloscyllium plagiosum]|uniref:uncharacterized protein si:ch211-244b2.4 n=1 Tax=Chiloscyllium plagiosum TaxID=36176 RepID=UPI001CB86E7E|nr:uncharacterized protein si:ch211-244b2.4 [Chiloscyllium plagiosum]